MSAHEPLILSLAHELPEIRYLVKALRQKREAEVYREYNNSFGHMIFPPIVALYGYAEIQYLQKETRNLSGAKSQYAQAIESAGFQSVHTLFSVLPIRERITSFKDWDQVEKMIEGVFTISMACALKKGTNFVVLYYEAPEEEDKKQMYKKRLLKAMQTVQRMSSKVSLCVSNMSGVKGTTTFTITTEPKGLARKLIGKTKEMKVQTYSEAFSPEDFREGNVLFVLNAWPIKFDFDCKIEYGEESLFSRGYDRRHRFNLSSSLILYDKVLAEQLDGTIKSRDGLMKKAAKLMKDEYKITLACAAEKDQFTLIEHVNLKLCSKTLIIDFEPNFFTVYSLLKGGFEFVLKEEKQLPAAILQLEDEEARQLTAYFVALMARQALTSLESGLIKRELDEVMLELNAEISKSLASGSPPQKGSLGEIFILTNVVVDLGAFGVLSRAPKHVLKDKYFELVKTLDFVSAMQIYYASILHMKRKPICFSYAAELVDNSLLLRRFPDPPPFILKGCKRKARSMTKIMTKNRFHYDSYAYNGDGWFWIAEPSNSTGGIEL